MPNKTGSGVRRLARARDTWPEARVALPRTSGPAASQPRRFLNGLQLYNFITYNPSFSHQTGRKQGMARPGQGFTKGSKGKRANLQPFRGNLDPDDHDEPRFETQQPRNWLQRWPARDKHGQGTSTWPVPGIFSTLLLFFRDLFELTSTKSFDALGSGLGSCSTSTCL